MATDGKQVSEITGVVNRWSTGDEPVDAFAERLLYNRLRRIAARLLRRERPNHPLQAPDLIHEAYLRLRRQRAGRWLNRAQFFKVAARLMRRILSDHARRQSALKRAAQEPSTLEEIDGVVSAADDDAGALALALANLETRHPRGAEVLRLRFVVGLTVEETATALRISTATVKRECRQAREWLRSELQTDA